jgi:uncharacterized protein (TIGR03790 family)
VKHRHIAFILSFWLSALALVASALGPHELALVINRNSPDSIEIAHHYARLRLIPSSNLVYIDLPHAFIHEIDPEAFRTVIYEPVQKELEQRRITDHILAWAYSADFPTRVLTTPQMSLTGATFVRGAFPSNELIAQGTYLSPFYRGPHRPGDAVQPSISLQDEAVRLRDRMPLPAMLLAYTGQRGIDPASALDSLRRAAAADGTQPRDPFYFHVSDDVRSKLRDWQFEAALAELKSIGMPAMLSSNAPAPTQPLSGLMLGTATPVESWGRFQPGSIVDNLTSFGGLFATDEQVKLVYWIRLGASASAGTVVEPGSLEFPVVLWGKFPNARIFAHYARGCTALESYMQSVRCPLQLLPVGDPLSKPWSRPIPLTLISLEETTRPLSGEISFMASSLTAEPGMNYLFLLSGRYLPAPHATPGIRLHSKNLADGWHELRAVAYSPGPVRRQGHARLDILIDNAGRSARIATDADPAAIDYRQPFDVRIAATAGATELLITAHEREIWRGAATDGEQTVTLQPDVIGPGPAPLHAVALYADGMRVRSAPLSVNIRR